MGGLNGRAVVIGAGMGGLTAAAAIAPFFAHVTIVDRDVLPDAALPRVGVPQGRLLHALLAGGQQALEDLFPGFTDAILAAGAAVVRNNEDVRFELPGYDPFPQRDLGLVSYWLSRPLLEGVVRRLLKKQADVTIRERCRARTLELGPDGAAVTGVRATRDGVNEELIPADLVVDASGRCTLTLAAIEALGRPPPEETTVGVDLSYASAVVTGAEIPAAWKVVMTMPETPQSTRGGLLGPLENGRTIIAVGGRKHDAPAAGWEGFLEFARGLRTPLIYEAIKNATPEGEIARYGFPESVRRHFVRLAPLPRGLLPIADSLCRFNPVYGQGMTLAAQEARLLKRLLAERNGALDGLAETFFAEAEASIDAAWQMSAIPDFTFPETRGERPPNFDAMLQYGRAFTALAARDAEVHKLDALVRNLLVPPAALADPAIMQRVLAILAEQSPAG